MRAVMAAVAMLVWGAVALGTPETASAQEGDARHVVAVARPRGAHLHARSEGRWVDLCADQCRLEIAPGAELGVSIDGEHPLSVGVPSLTEGALLTIRYDDQHLTRTYGLIVTVIGVVGALTLGLGGSIAYLSEGGRGDTTGPITSMACAAGVLALGLSVGLVLLDEDDHVEITVTPR